jgi:hypothetical protein
MARFVSGSLHLALAANGCVLPMVAGSVTSRTVSLDDSAVVDLPDNTLVRIEGWTPRGWIAIERNQLGALRVSAFVPVAGYDRLRIVPDE